MMMSAVPWWCSEEKCLPMGSSLEPLGLLFFEVFGCLLSVADLMFWKCILNLSPMWLLVWPTYWSEHCLQVMQYMRLLLLHEICFLEKYCLPVAVLWMMPEWSSTGQ